MDLGKLFSLSGRVGRKDYITVTAGIFLIVFVAGYVGAAGGDFLNSIVGLIVAVIALAVGIPTGFKRLHDTGKSGWWSLISLVPIIGWVWAFWLYYLKPGDEGPNLYGLNNNGSPFPDIHTS